MEAEEPRIPRQPRRSYLSDGNRTAVRAVVALAIIAIQIAGLVLVISAASERAAAAHRQIVSSQVHATAAALREHFRQLSFQISSGATAHREGRPHTEAPELQVVGHFYRSGDAGTEILADRSEALPPTRIREILDSVILSPADEPRAILATVTPEELYGIIYLAEPGGGVFGCIVDLGAVFDRLFSEIRIGEIGSVYALSPEGVVLFDVEREIIGESVFELHRGYTELLRFDERTLTEDRGVGEYRFIHRASGEEVRKLGAWEQVALGDLRFPVVLSVSPEEILGTLDGVTVPIVLLVVLTAAIFFSYMFYSVRQERTAVRAQEAHVEQLLEERTRSLAAREAQFRALFEMSGQPLLLADAETGIVQDANQAATELFECPKEELIGLHQGELHPEELREAARNHFATAAATGRHRERYENTAIKTRSGKIVPVDILTSFLEIGGRNYLYGAFVDMSVRRDLEAELRTTAEERSKLLREVQHRTKNNLALISSTLSMQARRIGDAPAAEAFKNAAARVSAMAELQSMLTVSDSAETVALDRYIERISRQLESSSALAGTAVAIRTELSPVETSAKLAVGLGLVVNELCTNAVKHAFLDRDSGRIDVLLHRDSDDRETWILEVIDDGAGIEAGDVADGGIGEESSLGITLVRGIAEQLDGEASCTGGTVGTHWTFRFRLEAG